MQQPRYTQLQAFTTPLRPRNMLEMTVANSSHAYTTDPEIFGPPFWFVLHNAAVNYPNNPTLPIRTGMKHILINLPIMVPCINCKEHFYTFLKNSNLDDAVSSKSKLFEFFWKIHNYVNRRYNKQEMSLEEAKRLYGFDAPATVRITYK